MGLILQGMNKLKLVSASGIKFDNRDSALASLENFARRF